MAWSRLDQRPVIEKLGRKNPLAFVVDNVTVRDTDHAAVGIARIHFKHFCPQLRVPALEKVTDTKRAHRKPRTRRRF